MEYSSFSRERPLDFSLSWDQPVTWKSIISHSTATMSDQEYLDKITQICRSSWVELKLWLDRQSYSFDLYRASNILKNMKATVECIPKGLQTLEFTNLVSEANVITHDYFNHIFSENSFVSFRKEMENFIKKAPTEKFLLNSQGTVSYSRYLNVFTERKASAFRYFINVHTFLNTISRLSSEKIRFLNHEQHIDMLWEGMTSEDRKLVAQKIEEIVDVEKSIDVSFTKIFGHYAFLAKHTQAKLMNESYKIFSLPLQPDAPEENSAAKVTMRVDSEAIHLLLKDCSEECKKEHFHQSLRNCSKELEEHVRNNYENLEFPFEIPDVCTFCDAVEFKNLEEFHEYSNIVSSFTKDIDDKIQMLRRRLYVQLRENIALTTKHVEQLRFGKQHVPLY